MDKQLQMIYLLSIRIDRSSDPEVQGSKHPASRLRLHAPGASRDLVLEGQFREAFKNDGVPPGEYGCN